MNTEIPARIVSYAVSDLLDERAREAWYYLDRWRAGIRSGVLAEDLRNALDVDLRPTEAGRLIGGWVKSGGRGVFVVCGGYGLGKTLTACRWLLRRHDQGLTTAWWLASKWPYDFSEQDALLSRLSRAPALIIDDLGDGQTAIATMAADARSKLSAVISERFGDGRATLILSNATKDEIESWLGGRLVDRLKVAGGITKLADAPSLRRHDDSKPDELGRSQKWHEARRIVALVGVERDGDSWRIGNHLESIPGRVDLVIRELGLDRGEIRRRALELLEQDQAAIVKLGEEIGETLPISSLDWTSAAPFLHDRIRRGAARADEERAEAERRRAAERASVAAALTFAEVEPPADVLPMHAAGLRDLALRYGLCLEDVDGEMFAVKHGERVLAHGAWSQRQAWWVAGRLIEREVTRREDGAACG